VTWFSSLLLENIGQGKARPETGPASILEGVYHGAGRRRFQPDRNISKKFNKKIKLTIKQLYNN
jgi:hypothetical protein